MDDSSLKETGEDQSVSYSSIKDNVEQERDEIEEVQKLARKETFRVNTMRLVIGMLLAAAFAVTFVTFRLLQLEQRRSFEAAVRTFCCHCFHAWQALASKSWVGNCTYHPSISLTSYSFFQFDQFSRTLAQAAIRHRVDITDAFNNHIQTVTAAAQSDPTESFPFFSPPFYERSAQNLLDQGRIEAVAICVKVKDDEYEDWIAYSNVTHEEWVQNAHIFQHGNLDYLNQTGYRPYITRVVPGEGLVKTEKGEKDEYYIHWNSYPSPASYLLINWDLSSVGGKGAQRLNYNLNLTAETSSNSPMFYFRGLSVYHRCNQSAQTGVARNSRSFIFSIDRHCLY